MFEWPSGTIAVNWQEKYVLIRSPFANYWHDSRYPNVGRMLIADSSVTTGRFTIIDGKGMIRDVA